MIDYAGRVWDEPAGQQAKGWGPLDRLYRASDRWFYLGAVGPDALHRLAAVEGLGGIDGLSGPDLEAALSARVAVLPAATWIERLTAAGVGAHVLRDIQEVMEDPWAKAHGLSVERDFPELGRVRTVGPSGRLAQTPLRLNPPAAPPGYHNREVLEEIGLGDRYEEFVTTGVIASGVGPRRPVPA
jgi:crotonobetainyl-CoA:carnitine CoA-transferase CaiB-like acyl-CoA transferase